MNCLDGKLNVRWEHDYKGKRTFCIIKYNGDRIIALSKCHKQDVYDKAIGRKLSLARVLMFGYFNKDERTTVWKEYFKYCNE